MDYCTIIPMWVHCDKWNMDLPLSVTYRFHNPSKPYSAVLQSTKCPVVENSKLPVYERPEEYKWLMCNNDCECVHLRSAPQEIEDTRITRSIKR